MIRSFVLSSLSLFHGAAVPAQDSRPAADVLLLKYDQEVGPRVTVKGDELSLYDFGFGDKPMTWPFDAALETVAPTPSRPGVGIRLVANTIDGNGKPCQMVITVHANLMIMDVKGLPPSIPLTIRCRVRAKKLLGMRAKIAERFEPPIIHSAIGDPDADCDLAYDPDQDRMFTFQPTGLTRLGRAEPDGSRWVYWNVKSSADGEVNALVTQIDNDFAAATWSLPLKALTGWVSHPPRAGWRSMAAYGKDLSADALVAEATLLHEKLHAYGMRAFQIDDGWQSRVDGKTEARVWKPDVKIFPRGLAPVLATVKSLGLTPGLWLIPQAAEVGADTPGILTNFDGKPVSGGAAATQLWDHSTPEGREAMRGIIGALVKDGAERFYFDGQREAFEILKQNLKLNEDLFAAQRRYRSMLTDLRALGGETGAIAIGGAKNFSGQLPDLTPESAGIADSIQILGERLDRNWSFEKGIAGIGIGSRLHGWAIDADPGLVRVGESVTIGIARSWATLVALTGQQFFISERMAALAEPRVEVLRRTIGGPAIRTINAPVDCVLPRRTRLWRELDGETTLVTGYFSYDSRESPTSVETEGAAVADMAGAEKAEFWTGRFLGRALIESHTFLPDVDKRDCLVVAARKPKKIPMVVSTSRHVTNAAGDLTHEKFDGESNTLTGTSSLIAGDPYEIRIVKPTREWIVKNAMSEGVECQVLQEGRLARIRMASPRSMVAHWKVVFDIAKDPAPKSAPAITDLRASNGGGVAIRLDWSDELSPTGAFLVKRDGVLLGSAATPRFFDGGAELTFGSTYSYEVIPYDDEGNPGASSTVEYLHAQPPRASMIQVGYRSRRAMAYPIVENYSVMLSEFSVNGTIHRTGLGLLSPLTLDVPLRGAAGVLLGMLAIDDGAGGKGSVQVTVKVDDAFLLKTPVITGGGKPYHLRVPITPGAKMVTLEIDDCGDGSAFDFVDFISPEIHSPQRR